MPLLICASVSVAAYLQALHFPFVIDDTTYISNNTKLAGLHLNELWRLFVEPYNNMYEFLPLRELTYWLDMTFFGLNPAVFRVHSIVLYLICLPLVYGITARLWRFFRADDIAGATWASAAVTALFALHPAHAEAVVWVAGRKDVLAGMFSLLALWLAVKAKSEHGISTRYACATIVALAAAMLSKATAIATVLVVVLLWLSFWISVPKPNRRNSLLLWPVACLLLAAGIVILFAASYPYRVPLYFGTEAATRSLAILGWLARLSWSPESRHFFYPVFEDPFLPAMVAAGILVLILSVAGGWLLLRKRAIEAFALFVFLLLCLPSLQLIPYAPPSLISDRFIFLAVWPAALLLVSLVWRFRPLVRAGLLLCIALLWGMQTIERPRDWRSQESLIETDMRAFPGYYMPASYKITTQLLKGMNRDAAETARGIGDPVPRNVLAGLVNSDYLVRVIAVETGDSGKAVDLLMKLGAVLKTPPEQAKWNTPMHQFWETCRTFLLTQWSYLADHFPGDVSLRYYAGLSSLDLGRYKDAVNFLKAATESQALPDVLRGRAFHSYGVALMKGGYHVQVEAALRAALAQPQPDLRAQCTLAEFYALTGRAAEAAQSRAACPDNGGRR